MHPRRNRRAPGTELLALLAENATDIIYRIRLAPEMAYEYISPSVATVLGYSPDEFYADAGLGIATVHPDDRAAIMDPGTVPAVMRSIHKDGRILHLEVRNHLIHDDRGQPAAIEGIARDVTERITAELAVRRSEANLRVLMDFAPDLILVTDENARVVYANHATGVFFGVAADSLLGRPVFELVSADQHAHAAERHSQSMATGSALAPTTYRARRGDDTEALAEFRSLRVTWDGKPSSLGYGRDVTESRALEARLALSERMASIGTLAAGVAHEINNPLAYVTASLERASVLLAGDSRPSPELITLVRDAREGADRIARIVRDIRNFARPDAAQRGPVDVIGAIERAVELVQSRLRLRAQLVLELGDVPPALADEARVVQVLLNLLVNAIEALPDGHADHHPIRVVAATVALDDGDRVVIEVHDDGPGIPADVVGRIFDPFFTTKPVGAGMGLGLALSHGIVTSLGGDITVASEPVRGSVFRVVLTVAAAPPAPAPPPVLDDKAPPSPRARVLIIDDEAVLTKIMTAALRDRHDVVASTSAQAALHRLRAGEDFDVVFCDLMMPQMTGMDFYDALAEVAPALRERVVFLSGGTFTDTAASFLARVPNPHLEKPFPLRALHEAVADRLANRG